MVTRNPLARAVGRTLAAAALAAGPVAVLAQPFPRDTQDQCGTGTAGQRPPSHPGAGPGEMAGPTSRIYGPYGPLVMVPPINLVPPPGTEGVGRGLPSGTGSEQPSPVPPAAAPPPLPGLPARTATGEKDDRPRVGAIQATGEIPEERLLDVGIQVLGSAEVDLDRGQSLELRRAEARFVSFHLKKTIEGTGHWGAVRVVPGPGEGIDVFVTGRILESNGKRLELEIQAADARGERWLERRYKGEADTTAYRTRTGAAQEPFQEVYNLVANDLLGHRETLDAAELVRVRRVSALRFASALSPEAFSAYLDSRKGRFALLRLPAEDDPTVKRVASIRERDLMFVDTLNEHYLTFYDRMGDPYRSWRAYSYEEQEAIDRITRESRLKKILGGAAVLAGVLIDSDSRSGDAARQAAIYAGMAAMEAGFRQSGEAAIHKDALQELAISFEGEVAPLLVEVEGQQVKLTGSAETQFTAWRELLRQFFALETGQPIDPNAVTVTAPSRP